ncbi:MAG: hypothetical protein A2Y80_01780 [Deltaproteobacteria bacterium RBG_13_58_19]|nr:MAG: hypothetical protein A2Y80_01780 [Deltaproteobacteria bacterium RBG_13_58_19]
MQAKAWGYNLRFEGGRLAGETPAPAAGTPALKNLISWKLLQLFRFFGGDMAFSPVRIIVGTVMLVPGELHFIPIPGLGVETFSLPQRGRVRCKMFAIHTANQVHIASLLFEAVSQTKPAVPFFHRRAAVGRTYFKSLA